MQTKIPLSVVETLLRNQNEFNLKLVEIVSLHLEKCATLYEHALNPPMPDYSNLPAPPRLFMSEEEEDIRFAQKQGDLDNDDRLLRMFDESPVYVDSD